VAPVARQVLKERVIQDFLYTIISKAALSLCQKAELVLRKKKKVGQR